MDYKEKIISVLTNKELTLEQQQQLEKIFPELAESNDERIRKELIAFLKENHETGRADETWSLSGIERWIAWLEKQGEQKPTDKVEPKFKVGDWCIDNEDNTIFQITKVLSNLYYYRTNEGKEYSCTRDSIERDAHLWNIQDAKDGDVLVYGDNPNDYHVEVIMIFKSLRYKHSAFTHFHIFDDEFRTDDWCDCGENAHPATKEQRDALMKAMADAGYTFDFEKKELKKIEHKPAWSEDDEKNLQGIIDEIEANKHDAKEYEWKTYDRFLNWLKSIKNRVQPQPKQEWSEEDEKRIENIISVLDVQVCWTAGKKENPYQNEIDWLKSLKDRLK